VVGEEVSLAFSGSVFSPVAEVVCSSAEEALAGGWEVAEDDFFGCSLQPEPSNNAPLMANESHHFQDFFITFSLLL
jgi:hypothetical protein